jgi:hypothetical protein
VAKEFKAFDKKYAHVAGTALKEIEAIGGKIPREDIDSIEAWPHVERFTEDYSQASVNYAVYEAHGAEEWQKFRVSLKGLTTREKLYALAHYYDMHIAPGAGVYGGVEIWSRQLIRVNNYLGALKRGGQLDSNLRVVK